MEAANTEQARCHRCGRVLRAPKSVARNYGPGCAAIIRAAAVAEAVAGFSAGVVEKARQLVEDGGIVAIRDGIYKAASSDGLGFWLVSALGPCNCPAGLRSRACNHFVAARIMRARKAA